MAEYRNKSDFSGTAHKEGGDKFILDRYAVVTPNYSQYQDLTTGKYNINDCKAKISYSGGKYWGDSNLASGYSYQLHQGWSYNTFNTGNTRGDGLANLSQSGWVWCDGWSTTETWYGGGEFEVDLSRDGTKNIYFNFGTRRSEPFIEGNGAHPSWMITISFEKCPKRIELKDPTINVRSQTQIKGSVNCDSFGVPLERIDNRLQKVQSPYSYGNDVIGDGWHGEGDYASFDYKNLTANTQYELHTHAHASSYNDYPSNGNQEGTIVRTTRHWTLPQVGSATVSVSMKSATSFDWSRTDGGTWITTKKLYRIRYKQSTSSSWTTTNWSENTSGTISGLSSGKIYNVQIQPQAKGGGGDTVDGEWSATVNVQLGKLWTVTKITSTGSEKTKINGLAITAKDGVPAITAYQFRIRKNGTTNWTTSNATTTNSWDATGLSPNTKYDVQGRVQNVVGWSEWSSSFTFYTKPSAGTTSAQCVRNRDLGKLSIKVNTGGTWAPAANSYQIRYKLSTVNTWTEVTASSNQTQVISNLTQKTDYQFQVRARTGTGVDGSSTDWSAWSSTITVKTVKTNNINDVEWIDSTTNSVNVKVTYTNEYPNANRIYYALTPMSSTSQNRVTNMFVSTSASPTTFKITKNYQNNALTPNTEYKCYIFVNQYKANADWYTAGLDLLKSTYSIFVATKPNVGTITNVKCIKNNDYKSLTIHAEKSGTWSQYAGWQYRYKVSSAADSTFTLWSNTTTGDKVINDLKPGETYSIQVRGSTGEAADNNIYYSGITTLTIKVVKRPTIQLSINSITTNKVKLVAKIVDKGYPELNKLYWNYASNSFITLSYVPGTYIQQGVTNTSDIKTTNVFEYTLYKQAMYDLRVDAHQYKAGSDWYTAGIDNKTQFIYKDVELSLYSSRSDRLKTYQGGFKQVDKFRYYTNKWNYTGQAKDNKNSTNEYEFAYCKNFNNLYDASGWFSDSTGPHAHNQYVKDNFKVYVPLHDNVRKDISTAYGGNLLPIKLNIDFRKLSTSNLYFNNHFEYKVNKNSISLKLKDNITLTNNWVHVLNISNLQDFVNILDMDAIYIEYNVNVIPVSGDSNKIGSAYIDYTNFEGGDQHVAELISKFDNSKSRYLICIPTLICKDYEKQEKYQHFYNGVIRFNINNQHGHSFEICKKGSIINFSNFGFYALNKQLADTTK